MRLRKQTKKSKRQNKKQSKRNMKNKKMWGGAQLTSEQKTNIREKIKEILIVGLGTGATIITAGTQLKAFFTTFSSIPENAKKIIISIIEVFYGVKDLGVGIAGDSFNIWKNLCSAYSAVYAANPNLVWAALGTAAGAALAKFGPSALEIATSTYRSINDEQERQAMHAPNPIDARFNAFADLITWIVAKYYESTDPQPQVVQSELLGVIRSASRSVSESRGVATSAWPFPEPASGAGGSSSWFPFWGTAAAPPAAASPAAASPAAAGRGRSPSLGMDTPLDSLAKEITSIDSENIKSVLDPTEVAINDAAGGGSAAAAADSELGHKAAANTAVAVLNQEVTSKTDAIKRFNEALIKFNAGESDRTMEVENALNKAPGGTIHDGLYASQPEGHGDGAEVVTRSYSAPVALPTASTGEKIVFNPYARGRSVTTGLAGKNVVRERTRDPPVERAPSQSILKDGSHSLGKGGGKRTNKNHRKTHKK